MGRRKRIATEAEFDLEFLRDIKHRLRMTLREIEKAEKWLAKAAKFQRGRNAKGTAEEIEAAIQFYAQGAVAKTYRKKGTKL